MLFLIFYFLRKRKVGIAEIKVDILKKKICWRP